MADTPHADIAPLSDLTPGQATKANNSFNRVDAAFPLFIVKDRDLTAPPGSESDGDLYIPKATATGDWAGNEGKIEAFYNGYLVFTPLDGWFCWIIDEKVMLRHNGTSWSEYGALGSVSTGISAAGTTQGAGTVLTSRVNVVTTITAASAEAVVLPLAETGKMVVVANDDSADTLKVFPASGDSIDSGSVDASADLAAGKRAILVAQNAVDWLMVVGA